MKTFGKLALVLSMLAFGCAPSATTQEKLENAATSTGEAVEDTGAAAGSATQDAVDAADTAVDSATDEN